MHKNYRRKIKQNDSRNDFRDGIRNSKNSYLKDRTVSRRQRDRCLLRRGLYEDESFWDDIPCFEDPVDWYIID